MRAIAPGSHEPSTGTASPIRYERRVVRQRDGARVVVHLAAVDLCDARVSLRSTAPDEGGATVSAWAHRVGATVAINGDFFDAPGPRPLGPARGAGRDWPTRTAYYYDVLLAIRSGSLPEIITGNPSAAVTDIVASQERIVTDGQPTLSPYVRHSLFRHPRSAIGITRDGRTLIFAVADGRSSESAGMTTPELGRFMHSLGVWNALRMDGGGSSTMFLGRRGVVNRPSDGHERAVANHIGVIVDATVSPTRAAWCRVP